MTAILTTFLFEAREAVFLNAHETLVLAVLHDVLADLGKRHDEAVDRPIVIVQMSCQNGLSAVSHRADDGVDIVRSLDGRDLKKHVGFLVSVFLPGGRADALIKRKIASRVSEKIHAFEVRTYLARLREQDRFLHKFEHTELADLEEPHHAVGIDEGHVTEIDLFRADEGLEGLFKSLFCY
jgi:hypothetical protein